MRRDARERLLDGVLAALCENPDEPIEPPRHLAEARVSRAQFEAEFGDREGLLAAAAERLGDTLVGVTAEACAGAGEWPSRVAGGLGALLGRLAERPGLARVAMCSLPGRSRAAHQRYQETLERFAELLSGGRVLAPAGTELPREVEMLAAGAAEAIIFEEVEAGRAKQLPELGPEILYSVLVPFLGPEEAGAEARRAS